MTTPTITRATGTGSLASKPQQVDVAESDPDLAVTLMEHERLALSTINVVADPLVIQVFRALHVGDDAMSDRRWATLLHDAQSYDLLDRMAADALAEDDAGLTLDLDELLS